MIRRCRFVGRFGAALPMYQAFLAQGPSEIVIELALVVICIVHTRSSLTTMPVCLCRPRPGSGQTQTLMPSNYPCYASTCPMLLSYHV